MKLVIKNYTLAVKISNRFFQTASRFFTHLVINQSGEDGFTTFVRASENRHPNLPPPNKGRYGMTIVIKEVE